MQNSKFIVRYLEDGKVVEKGFDLPPLTAEDIERYEKLSEEMLEYYKKPSKTHKKALY
jgi:hypothetical protein